MFTKAYLALAVLASYGLAAPLVSTNVFGLLQAKEQLNAPRSWVQLGAPAANTKVTLQIGLKQSNMQGLQEKLMDISDPKSANYGKWLTLDEVNAYKQPAPETVSTVKKWLSAAGVAESSLTQTSPDWISVELPVSDVETLLGASYSMFSHPNLAKPVPRTLKYSLPESLHGLIDTVQPTTAFYAPNTPQVNQKSNSTTAQHSKRQTTCDPNHITPACINSYYNVDYTSAGRSDIGVTGMLGLSASHADAQQFCGTYGTGCSDFADGSIGGGANSGAANLEGNLDTQYALGLGYPNPATFYDCGPDGNDFGDQVLNLATSLSGDANHPTSVSTSYIGEEPGFAADYLDRVCNEFMTAGARGISIFFASGDDGVGGISETDCSATFYPIFPASCTYVTAVGATQINSDQSESVAIFGNGGSSGGGFSGHFATADYQSADTSSYINGLNGQYNGLFNAGGRGYPDVSLVGQNFDIIVSGAESGVSGTSASSPAFAALVSVLNDYLIGEGKPTLGFINPLLYGSARSAMKDTTVGSNTATCGSSGFPATAGWDPATGLGSLNFGALRAML